MSRPIIIAHRGASGDRPEHTLEAYELAIAQGADAIELDIVPTKDGELIVRHESELSQTTNIKSYPQLAHHYTTKTIYQQDINGWFTEDLTLAEIKKLRAKEPWEFRSSTYNNQFPILTLSEVLQWHKITYQTLQRPIELYLEIKHSRYFRKLGLPIEEPLVALLKEYGYQYSIDPILILSFEIENLKYLRSLTNLRLIQLMSQENDQPYDLMMEGDRRTYEHFLSPPELSKLAKYASGLGLSKQLLWSFDSQSLIETLHHLSFTINVWTFRNETCFILSEFAANPEEEYQAFLQLGIDGIITDYPNTALAACDRYSDLV